jgi:hypothetical protein
MGDKEHPSINGDNLVRFRLITKAIIKIVLYIFMYQKKPSMIGTNGRRVMLGKCEREDETRKLFKLYAQLRKGKDLCVGSPAS